MCCVGLNGVVLCLYFRGLEKAVRFDAAGLCTLSNPLSVMVSRML